MKYYAVGGVRVCNALRVCIVLGVWFCLLVTAGCRSMRQEGVKNKENYFQTLTARVDLRIHSPKGKEIACPMELRTVRDSVIVLSVRPLAGIEVARIRLDGNGFLIVNRFDRVYAEGVYNELDILQGMEVPAFARIQTLLTERVFVEEEQLFFRELVGIRFSQVQTDIPVATDVVIPLKYRRITIQELFESIKKKI